MIKIVRKEELDFKKLAEFDMERNESIEKTVAGILSEVKRGGDSALLNFTEKFDGVRLSSLVVTEEEIAAALSCADREFLAVLNEAKENIVCYHERQKKEGFRIEKEDGIVLGQKYTPIERVGVYVPGGTASYPSTVLMDVLPAKIAGVKEIVMVTPPAKDGRVKNDILVAAAVAGVDKIFKVGGAQGIAALAYGTETVTKVDKIVGPGNIFVATAKKQVFGQVGIDMIAGPSEITIVADKTANVSWLAADLLSQAEHDRLARPFLITDDVELAYKVAEEVEAQLLTLPRKDIAKYSIDNSGLIILTKSTEESIACANILAPEHLELCVEEPFSFLDSVKNAGSVFLGGYTPEGLGDYFSGTNHTLPTSGTARFFSPLSVDDFVKKSCYSYYSEAALRKVKDKIALFAEREGLRAHAAAVLKRFENE